MVTISFRAEHGSIDGLYAEPNSENSPLVIITNGHNGFYRYGMFPYIQEWLQDHGISSYSYNFSHGGINGDSDSFEDLVAYEKNCMRLETLDLLTVLDCLSSEPIGSEPTRRLYLLTHSLGTIPTLFAARQAEKMNTVIAGIILLAPISTLDLFSVEVMEEWQKTGVLFMHNNRTGQELPQGSEFLTEILAAGSAWNVKEAIRDLSTSLLLIHGDVDSDAPISHSNNLQQWALECGIQSELETIQGAGHTFNTKHPFDGPSPELRQVLERVRSWIRADAD